MDEETMEYIETLQIAIKQLGKDIQGLKETIIRDKQDQWRYISELSDKVDEYAKK